MCAPSLNKRKFGVQPPTLGDFSPHEDIAIGDQSVPVGARGYKGLSEEDAAALKGQQLLAGLRSLPRTSNEYSRTLPWRLADYYFT